VVRNGAKRRRQGACGYLLDVSLREVEDEVPDARDGDERAGAGVPELVEEGIPRCSETTTET
jgi:hypothetical protein